MGKHLLTSEIFRWDDELESRVPTLIEAWVPAKEFNESSGRPGIVDGSLPATFPPRHPLQPWVADNSFSQLVLWTARRRTPNSRTLTRRNICTIEGIPRRNVSPIRAVP